MAATSESVAAHYNGPDRDYVPATGPPTKLLTDLGNARRFIEQHGDNLRYCKAWGKWVIWDGICWKPDVTDEIFQLAKETVERIWDEAKTKTTEEEKTKCFQWARASQSEGKIRAMVSLATSERQAVVEPHQLDCDAWLLNCASGILDLRTGELRPSAREDLCTKQVRVKYDAYAECPLWRKFLKTVTGENEELEAYLQQISGYALTGSTRQQVMFVLYGTGANGKTTFLEILRTLLGDYAQHADFTSFLASKDAGPRNDLARLVGARLVTAVEVERGKRLSEATIKQITGGDPITCRFLFREPFEYTPQFKLFLAANHKPRIPGGEHAIWRRVKVIPFTVRIPPERQDPELLAKLRTELPGILAWAVEGCRRWQEPGFDTPAAVLEAIEEYREEMDPLAGFIEACCTSDPEASTPSAKLYEAYVSYCNETKEEPLKKNWFGTHLAERGFHARRKGKERDRGWLGIRLQPAKAEQDGQCG
jgi:putative DNA primase/helicase